MDRHQRLTELQLMIGGFVLLVFAGGGIVLAFLGPVAALIAVGFVLLGAGLLVVLWLLVSAMGRWAGPG